jgi:hypothetical protein
MFSLVKTNGTVLMQNNNTNSQSKFNFLGLETLRVWKCSKHLAQAIIMNSKHNFTSIMATRQ